MVFIIIILTFVRIILSYSSLDLLHVELKGFCHYS